MKTYLGRGIDYLGDLGAKLRDLRGYRTLAHELLQNADDASSSTQLTFNVTAEALIVDNDGIFSDCGDLEAQECPWRQHVLSHRCDFHRFRHIAGGDKRAQAGTTGAFGIGFISVYQITDCPELISAGQHWVLNETAVESERIEVCGGCPTCRIADLPGTRFILPWATDKDSDMRKALRAEAVPGNAQQEILSELEAALPLAILFLKHIDRIEVLQDGHPHQLITRVRSKNQIAVTNSRTKGTVQWHTLEGSFTPAATNLRSSYPGLIEEKRGDKVVIAIPTSASAPPGLLCASLPSEHTTGLPFFINADFYPTSDRKRIIFERDFQSAWNRAALNCAARVLAEHVEKLPTVLGPVGFWALLSALKNVVTDAEKSGVETAFVVFWEAVSKSLRDRTIIYTSNGRWLQPDDVRLLASPNDAQYVSLLSEMGIAIVHEHLRPYYNLLRSEEVGVELIDIATCCEILEEAQLTKVVNVSSVPGWLASAEKRRVFWRFLASLLERAPAKSLDAERTRRRLSALSIAVARDGKLWPSKDLFYADEQSVRLFSAIGATSLFVALEPDFSPLASLCKPFMASDAIDALRSVGDARLTNNWRSKTFSLTALYDWFLRHGPDETKRLRESLASLPIFPANGKLQELSRLALPGQFADPLGLASLIDADAIGNHTDFLKILGVRELDFQHYALNLLPAALADAGITTEQRRAAIHLLATKLNEIRDIPEAKKRLQEIELIECADGEFRQASDCYFPTGMVAKCLSSVPIADVPTKHKTAVRALYEWLGVADEPRSEDILDEIRLIARGKYDGRVKPRIDAIVGWLSRHSDAAHDLLREISNTAWLPAAGHNDRWYFPRELHAAYQHYLFESQGTFVDLSVQLQAEASDLLPKLGVRATPDVSLVVRHLLHCASRGAAVSSEVYRFLNMRSAEPAIRQLASKPCLYLGDTYVSPLDVFWGDHPFGPYAYRLPEHLRDYGKFLDAIGVKEVPDCRDAIRVLERLSKEFGERNAALDDAHVTVAFACWRIIDRAFDIDEAVRNELSRIHAIKCVPDARCVLAQPQVLFIENRPGLAARFDAGLAPHFIKAPLGAERALREAGVRRLASAVRVQLLDSQECSESKAVSERVRSRKGALARVIASQDETADRIDALQRLEQLKIFTADRLVVRYTLDAFDREWQSAPEKTPAVYNFANHELFICSEDGSIPWPVVARELAVALFPNGEPGKFAAGFKEALSPDDEAEASKLLDELGFAHLDVRLAAPIQSEIVVTSLGVDHGGTEEPIPLPPAHVISLTSSGTERERDASASDHDTQSEPSGEIAATELPSRSLTSSGGQNGKTHDGIVQPQSSGTERGAKDAIPSATPATTGETNPAPNRRREVLRSYVQISQERAEDQQREDQNESAARSAVDVAGVAFVISHELRSGRHPREMPHNNPGYDIESCDEKGEIVRYIEVKSFSKKWDGQWAVLSQQQFAKALGYGERYWLYVVEEATGEDPKLYRIQSPPAQANHFMFDGGWAEISEPDWLVELP